MYRSSSTRIFPIILIIVIVVALIAGIVTVGNYIFSGNGDTEEQKTQAEVARDELLKVGVDRSVSMTVRGNIVGDESFRSYQIVISPSEREYIVYKGYLEEVLSRKTYENNIQAYEQFVHALDKAALTTAGKYTTEEAGDLRGVCATGRIYQYDILSSGSVAESYWTSTCKGSPGTFGANVAQVTNLFTAQIPGNVEFNSQYTAPTLQ